VEENYYSVLEICDNLSHSLVEKVNFLLTPVVDITGREFFSETRLGDILPKDALLHIKNTCSQHTFK